MTYLFSIFFSSVQLVLVSFFGVMCCAKHFMPLFWGGRFFFRLNFRPFAESDFEIEKKTVQKRSMTFWSLTFYSSFLVRFLPFCSVFFYRITGCKIQFEYLSKFISSAKRAKKKMYEILNRRISPLSRAKINFILANCVHQSTEISNGTVFSCLPCVITVAPTERQRQKKIREKTYREDKVDWKLTNQKKNLKVNQFLVDDVSKFTKNVNRMNRCFDVENMANLWPESRIILGKSQLFAVTQTPTRKKLSEIAVN